MEHSKGNKIAQNQMGSRNLIVLDFPDDLSDENLKKTNEFLDVSRVKSAKIVLTINVKKAKSLRLGIRESNEMMLVTKRLIKWIASFTQVVLSIRMMV